MLLLTFHVNVKLHLCIKSQIPQYKLDARLSRLLGIHTQTRAVIVNALWQYIRVTITKFFS